MSTIAVVLPLLAAGECDVFDCSSPSAGELFTNENYNVGCACPWNSTNGLVAGYEVAVHVDCNDRDEDDPDAQGMPGETILFESGEGTAESCAAACETTMGCCGFNYNFKESSSTFGRCVAKGCHCNSLIAKDALGDNFLTSRYGSAWYSRQSGADWNPVTECPEGWVETSGCNPMSMTCACEEEMNSAGSKAVSAVAAVVTVLSWGFIM